MNATIAELHNLMGGCWWHGDKLAADTCRNAIAEIERLETILAPFQAVAEKIPPHWPSGEQMRIERYAGLSYCQVVPGNEPTIDQWRTTLEVKP